MKSASKTPIVRISHNAHELLREMAREDGPSMQEVLDCAIERFRRDRFLHGANADYEALKRDSKAWKDELLEREIWEQTVAHGLGKK
jgi:hypothetical protein